MEPEPLRRAITALFLLHLLPLVQTLWPD